MVLQLMSKDKFMKAYANIIEDERNEIVVIIEEKPYTWNRAFDEIKNDTELGRKILEKLVEIGIISGD